MINSLENRKVNIAVITETKKKPKGTWDEGDWAMMCSGVKKTERAVCRLEVE